MGKAMESRGMRGEHRTRQQERKSPCESTYVFKLRKIWGESRQTALAEVPLQCVGAGTGSPCSGSISPMFRRIQLYSSKSPPCLLLPALPIPTFLLTQLSISGVITATVVKISKAAVSRQGVHDSSRADGVYKRCLPVSWGAKVPPGLEEEVAAQRNDNVLLSINASITGTLPPSSTDFS